MDTPQYKFSEIIDLDFLANIVKKIGQITGLCMGVHDTDGEIIIVEEWESICANYYRKNPHTACLCNESDDLLKSQLEEGKSKGHICANGIWDFASPIYINGVNMATIFTGQFFTEKPDLSFFEAQAKQYGFDHDEFMNALSKIPIIDIEKVNAVSEFLSYITKILSMEGINKLEILNNTKKIEYLSFHDKLTGVYNRTYFDAAMKEIDVEENLPMAVIIGDLNGLKLANDVFGHRAGDELLTRCASIISKHCNREKDLIVRWGGDEFVIILPNTDEELANVILQKIYADCTSVSDLSIVPSISFGVSMKNDSLAEVADLINHAEERMYHNKLLEGKSLRNNLIKSLRLTLFEKSHETEEHATRLIALSQALGDKLKLSPNELDDLKLVALLHDIGKIAIRDEILNKPEALTELEWVEMKKHCEIGYRIAVATPELAHISEYILTHHEKWDGSGYPQKLVGEKIPLLSRIITLIDSYDVMTHARIYKKALSFEEAITEINNNKGKQFDPHLVDLFLEVLKDE
jgi:diguanylate cyclase (GGDEF)-like protein